jgi:hypothetical protein
MGDNFTITVDLDKKCAECGRGGAMPSQICLKCTGKAMSDKPMKSWQGRAVAARFKQNLKDRKRG